MNYNKANYDKNEVGSIKFDDSKNSVLETRSDDILHDYIFENVNYIRDNRAHISNFTKFALIFISVYSLLNGFIILFSLICGLSGGIETYTKFVNSYSFLIFVIGLNVSFITVVAVLGKIYGGNNNRIDFGKHIDKLIRSNAEIANELKGS